MCIKVSNLARTPIEVANKIFESTGSDSIEKPYLNSMLGQHLASNLCKTLNKCDVLKNGDFDMDLILRVNIL